MGNKAQAVGSVEYTKQGGTYFVKMVSDFFYLCTRNHESQSWLMGVKMY